MSSILERHRERFANDPSDPRAFEALEEAAYVAGDWDDLAELLARRLGADDLTEKPSLRARLLHRLGETEARRERMDAARQRWQEAVAADSGCRAAFVDLRRDADANGRWDVALQIADAELALEMPSDERAEVLADVAALWLDRMEDAEQAWSYAERCLDLLPRLARALEVGARAAQALDRPADAETLWGRLAETTRGADRERALVAQAELAARAPDGAERALEIYRRAHAENPDHPAVLEALADHAEREGDWSIACEHLARRCEQSRDDAERGQLAWRIGRIHWNECSDAAPAKRWLELAVDALPSQLAAWDALADVQRELHDDEGLLHALRGRVANGETEAGLAVRAELASLESAAGDEHAAAEHLRVALELAPEDALVIEALSDSLSRIGAWDDLAECLERRAAIASSDPELCAAAFADLGKVQSDHLDDADAARRSYERALQADPSHAGAVAALEEIYRKGEQWAPLRTLLQHAGNSAERRDRPGYLCALGDLLANEFDARDEAGDAYARALELDHTCAAAHRGRQLLAAEGDDPDSLVVAYASEAEVTQDHTRLRFLYEEITRLLCDAQRGADALQWTKRWCTAIPDDLDALELACALHAELGHDAPRVAAIERLDPLVPSSRQAELRRELAELHEAHERPSEAVAAYQRALELTPDHLPTLRALVPLLEAARRPEELARALHQLAGATEGSERIESLEALVPLLAERLGDAGGAVDVLLRLADEPDAPADVETRLEAMFERTARYEELAERLALRAERASGEEAQALALRRGALLLEHLTQFDEAIGAYQSVLDQDPNSEAARRGLERALRAAGDPRALATFLGGQAEREQDPEERDRYAFECAVIQEEVLRENESAGITFHRLVREAANPETAQRASERLVALLERSEDFEALRAHLEEQLRRSEDSEARTHLHLRLGQLCRERLDDAEAAIDHLEQAAALSPETSPAWAPLAQLYEEQERPGDLARVLEAQLADSDALEPGQEQALRSRVATLCANELQESDRARTHYERVLEIDPGDSAAGEFLIQYWEANDRPEEVVRLLEARLSALDHAARDESGHWAAKRTSLRLRIAGLRAVALDDPDGAIAVLEPGLAEIGHVAAVAEPLADLYQRCGYDEDLITLCQKAAEVAEPGLERSGWLSRLGEALRGRDRDREATEAFERALEDRPGDTTIEAALRDLYRALGAAAPLAGLLDAELARLGGDAEIPLRLELAALHRGPLDQPFDALRELRRVVDLDPSHAEALAEGLALAETLERPAVAREMLDLAMGAAGEGRRRTDLLVQRAGLDASIPERRSHAIEAYREVLGSDPARSDVRRRLRELLEAGGDWSAALDCRSEEAHRASDDARLQLLREGADLAWEHLGTEEALPWLDRLRRECPTDDGALSRIAEAHAKAGRWHAHLRSLEARIDACETPDAKFRVHCARARVLEKELGWPSGAIAAFEAALEQSPDDRSVLDHLERLYRETGRVRERATTLEHLAKGAAPADRCARLRDAAELWAKELRDDAEASRLLLLALHETPRDSKIRADLLRRLGSSLARSGPADAWARCHEAELSALDPAAEVFAERRSTLRTELAAYYRRAGCIDDAILHLSALVDAGDTTPATETLLLDALRQQGNPVELEQRLAARLERSGGDSDGWLELARLRDEQLSATAQAAEAYRRSVAMATNPVDALRGLRSAAERLGRWDEVEATLELELDRNVALAPAERAALQRRLGDVCWQQLGSTARASRAYASAIESWPEDFAAQRALQQLLEAMEDWRGALDLYESEIEVLGEREPERRQAAWLRAGELARDRTDEIPRALHAYVQAAAIGPLGPEDCRRRAELHERCDEPAAFVEVFADWCDHPDADAPTADHVRLACALERLDRVQEARARCERALEAGATDAPAYRATARLRSACGATTAAAEAWEAAAEASEGREAAEAWQAAATLVRDENAEACAELLRKAEAAASDDATIQADLALATHAVESWSEAEAAAKRALDATDGALDDGQRLAVALAGGEAARQRDHLRPAAEFYARALETDPHCAAALDGAAETLASLQEWEAARAPLESRLAHDDANPNEAAHRALLARCLYELGEADAALDACEAVLALDAAHEDVHRLCVTIHEERDDRRAGVAALERHAEEAGDGDAAALLLRAARWELADEAPNEDAEAHLRQATERDGGCAAAWQVLAELLEAQNRTEEAEQAARAGLDASPSGDERASLTLVHARSIEARGDHAAAAEAYAEAVAADHRCLEAVIAQARLLRGAGEWEDAAEALAHFVERHPGDDAVGLAEVLQQLGGLRAGPLENVEGAIDAYRQALRLQPGREKLRDTLANLLSHRPEAWREALDQFHDILDDRPADATALRAVVRIAIHAGNTKAAENGRALLTALGCASPEEIAQAPARIALTLGQPATLPSPLGEQLRSVVQSASEEIREALGAPASMPGATSGNDPITRFRAAALAAEAELAAPGLLPLPTDELADVVRCVALLGLDPDAVHTSGATLNALSETVGRRTRKRIRRLLGETDAASIEAYEFSDWRRELRAAAAARAVDRGACNLRDALIARVCNAEDRMPDEFPEHADIAHAVQGCADARALFRRATRAWLRQISA